MSATTSPRWKRPDSVPFPSVWSRFDGRKEIDGKIPKFWIQDIPEDQFETIIKYMEAGFLNDEPTCTHSNLSSEPESVNDFKEMWRIYLKDRLGLVCYMENPDPKGEPIIAAMNCTHIVLKSEKNTFIKTTGKRAGKIAGCMAILGKKKDIFTELKIEKYLNALGLYVLPKFRGQNLGFQLLKAREPICKAVGIEATATAFTATVSQILAARVGFKEFLNVPYSEFEQIDPTIKFPGIEKHTKEMKYMYILY